MDSQDTTWQNESLSAMDVARMLRKPVLAKLDSGQYGCLDTEQQYVLHSRQCSTRVTAANVVWDGVKYVEKGASLAVPTTYAGWFRTFPHPEKYRPALLKTKGPFKCMAQLCASRVHHFLSRHDLTCFQVPPSDAVGVYMAQMFAPGEVFSVQGIYKESMQKTSIFRSCLKVFQKQNSNTCIQYLECVSASGYNVLIPMTTSGEFWEIGDPACPVKYGQVYQVHNLLDAIRENTEYFVELVHGKPPPKHEDFSKILRFGNVMKQEVIVACSIGEAQPTLLEFPLHSSVNFVLAKSVNNEFLEAKVKYVNANLKSYLSHMKVVKTILLRKDSHRNLPAVPKCRSEPGISTTDLDNEIASFISDTEFTDYDTIPYDEHIYENDGADVLAETAQRLREELAARLLTQDDSAYLSPAAICQRKHAQRLAKHGGAQPSYQLESFLVTTIDEMKRKSNNQQREDLDMNDQNEVDEFLDNMFDCDILSTSSASGAVLIAEDQAEGTKEDPSHDHDDQHSSLSSLYKKVKCGPVLPQRYDSGIGGTPGCSSSSCCELSTAKVIPCGSQVSITLSQTWIPPSDISTMSVEDVARSLKYIGLRNKLIERFVDEQIDGHQLAGMDENLLTEGFPEMNALDRKKLMDFKSGWRPKRDI